MHHPKYLLISSDIKVGEQSIMVALNNYLPGTDDVRISTGKIDIPNMKMAWSRHIIPFGYVDGLWYHYENIPKSKLLFRDGSMQETILSQLQADINVESHLGFYDVVTKFDREGKVIYPVMLPASRIMNFATYVEWRHDIKVYTSAEILNSTHMPDCYVHDLGGDVYKVIGPVPPMQSFERFEFMTFGEISEELSCKVNCANGINSSRHIAIEFKASDLHGNTRDRNIIDQHAINILNSLGYSSMEDQWMTFFDRIMNEHEQVLAKLGYGVYFEIIKKDYLKEVESTPHLKLWIERLLEHDYPVFDFGDRIQLIPFMHLYNEFGEYTNPFRSRDNYPRYNCTHFLNFTDANRTSYYSELLSTTTRPNFINRLAIYKKRLIKNPFYTIVRIY